MARGPKEAWYFDVEIFRYPTLLAVDISKRGGLHLYLEPAIQSLYNYSTRIFTEYGPWVAGLWVTISGEKKTISLCLWMQTHTQYAFLTNLRTLGFLFTSILSIYSKFSPMPKIISVRCCVMKYDNTFGFIISAKDFNLGTK